MYHQRSKFELYLELLTQVSNGVINPTRLMQILNLSSRGLNEALESLVSEGLLVEVRDAGFGRFHEYQVTEKGEKFIEYLGLALNEVNLQR